MADHITKLMWAVKEHLTILDLLSGLYSGLKQLFLPKISIFQMELEHFVTNGNGWLLRESG